MRTVFYPEATTKHARRPSCSTSTRSGWSEAAAARAARRISTSTTGRTSPRLCSRLSFRVGSIPPLAAGASASPSWWQPRCPWRHAWRPCRAAAAKRSSARCSSLSATQWRRRATNSTRACRLGPSRLFTVTLRATRRLSELLTHLYVLFRFSTIEKHYWVGDDEVEKLLRHGQGWLDNHPARDVIVSRYLVHQRGLVRDAIARLTAEEQPEEETAAAQKDEQEASIERTISLNERRLDAVFEVLKASGASRVLDLGCGEGKLLRRLLADHQFAEIVGMDVSGRVLESARSLASSSIGCPEAARAHSPDSWFADVSRQSARADSMRRRWSKSSSISTSRGWRRSSASSSSRASSNHRSDDAERGIQREMAVAAGRAFRHQDHRFEWTRAEFQNWANDVASPVRLRREVSTGRRRGRRGRASDADGGVRPMTMSRFPTLAGRPDRPIGLRQIHVRAQAFQAHRGAVVGLLPRRWCPTTRTTSARRTTPSTCCTSSPRKRLARGRLTVVDATNVQPEARKPLVALAREYHVLPVAIVLDLPEQVCQERNRSRPDRDFGPHVVRNSRASCAGRCAGWSARASGTFTC